MRRAGLAGRLRVPTYKKAESKNPNELTDDPSLAKVYLHGEIKSDGSSYVSLCAESGQHLNFDSREDAVSGELRTVMTRLYDLATNLMPGHDKTLK
jgi:hypothetical protein